jgi:hypothetical protein
VNTASDELLRAEYDSLTTSLRSNEESGEKRVTFFTGLVTGVGVLSLLLGDNGGLPTDNLVPPVLAITTLLVVLGYFTLLRIVRRNSVTDGYARGLDALRRRWVRERDLETRATLAFDPYGEPRRRSPTRRDGRKGRRNPASGGWVQTVSAINSLLVAALVYAWLPTGFWRIYWNDEARTLPPWLPLAAAFGAAVLSWLVQGREIRGLYRRADRPLDVLGNMETELAFLAVDGAALERLASIRRAGVCALVPHEESRSAMTDTYYDTFRNDLARVGAALRIRRVTVPTRSRVRAALHIPQRPRETTLLTVKGPGLAGTRMELEEEWSRRHLREALEAVGHLGVTLTNPQRRAGDPDEVLQRTGLRRIQKRIMKRVSRDVMLIAPDPHRIAELALDTVLYEIGGTTVVLHEVEIEVRGWASTATASAIAARLRSLEPRVTLRRWPYSKLHTGRVLEHLLKSELIRPDPNSELGIDDMDRLERALAERDSPDIS